MRRTIGCFVLLFCLLHGRVSGQTDSCRVVFYNVENLFDTRKDSLIADGGFTPRGKMYWTKERYYRKILNVSRVLLASERLPTIIGLAEVENRQVLLDLIRKTGLVDGNYGIVHEDSPDARGIDVALLYNTTVFRELRSQFFPVELGRGETTRDILYCKGVLREVDTLHFFVCHFPSMRGGEAKSEWKRVKAASVVREKVDSIQSCQPEAMIVEADRIKNHYEIYTYASRDEVEAMLQAKGLVYRDFTPVKMTLEDAFIGLTGKY